MLIRVNAAELKEVFRDVKLIFKGMQDAALMGFTVADHILYITCMNGIVYEQQIASEEPGPYSLTVLYQDLSEVLPGSGVVELDLSPLFVGIKSEQMSSVLQQANGIVSRYQRRGATFSKFDHQTAKNWASNFAETAPVAKSIQREAPIIFRPPYTVMKFPTFWLQLPNSTLDTVMDLRELRAIAGFGPTEIAIADNVIEFKRRSAILAIQRNTVASCKYIDDMLEDHGAAKTFMGGAFLSRIQQFMRSVGPGPCRCHFYSNGIELAVSRPNVQSSLRIGRCDTHLISISTFLEYIQMIFKLCGGSPFTLTTGKFSVCLRSSQLCMLLSII